MNICFETIYGLSVGFEIADEEVKEVYPDMIWGISFDFFIFRITLNKWRNE